MRIVVLGIASLVAVDAARSPMDTITFPVTVESPVARAAFERGMVALHSFAYADAHDGFRAAIAAEPGFAMALVLGGTFERGVW